MSESYNVSTSSNQSSVLDLAERCLGAVLTLGQTELNGTYSSSSDYKTEIRDDYGNVVSTGYGSSEEESRENAFRRN